MNIRLAKPGDLKSIDHIYNQAIELKMATADTVPYTIDERKEWLKTHHPDRYPAYVTTIEDLVVGYMTLSAYRPRREALRFVVEISYFVEEGHRGRGIGSSLLEYGLKIASEMNYKFVVAILMGHNDASIGLLKKYGFEEWGRLPGIAEYDGEWFDHLLYGLNLLNNTST